MLTEVNKIHLGDSLEILKQIPDEFVDCAITSPPYFNLRNYGIDGQIGLEETPEEYINKLVLVFREVRRVLKPQGTFWLNIGDSYSGSGKGRNPDGTVHVSALMAKQGTSAGTIMGNIKGGIVPEGLKPKDLIGIPWELAFALRADGYFLRQDIIWEKPNPMPESVKDRFTKCHEYIFLLSKNQHYYFDNEAIKELTVTKDNSLRNRDVTKLNNTPGRSKMKGLRTNNYDFRNKRSVWTVPTTPFRGAHFATFPKALAEIMIKAGCPIGGIALDPFGGAMTTCVVAKELKRKYIAIELNPEYIKMGQRRLDNTIEPMF